MRSMVVSASTSGSCAVCGGVRDKIFKPVSGLVEKEVDARATEQVGISQRSCFAGSLASRGQAGLLVHPSPSQKVRTTVRNSVAILTSSRSQ